MKLNLKKKIDLLCAAHQDFWLLTQSSKFFKKIFYYANKDSLVKDDMLKRVGRIGGENAWLWTLQVKSLEPRLNMKHLG